MILPPASVKALTKSLASCHEVRPTVEFLKRLADAVPTYRDMADNLATQLEHLQTLCETALEADRAIGE